MNTYGISDFFDVSPIAKGFIKLGKTTDARRVIFNLMYNELDKAFVLFELAKSSNAGKDWKELKEFIESMKDVREQQKILLELAKFTNKDEDWRRAREVTKDIRKYHRHFHIFTVEDLSTAFAEAKRFDEAIEIASMLSGSVHWVLAFKEIVISLAHAGKIEKAIKFAHEKMGSWEQISLYEIAEHLIEKNKLNEAEVVTREIAGTFYKALVYLKLAKVTNNKEYWKEGIRIAYAEKNNKNRDKLFLEIIKICSEHPTY